MKARVVAATFGALALMGLAACGSDGGTGAPPGTTVKLGAASFVTLPPVITSTTIAAATPEGGTVPGEQTYTIEAGDYPLKIAQLFCIDYTQLVSYNGWPDADHMPFPGTAIKIPPGACAPGSSPETTTAPAQDTTPEETTTTFDESSGGTYTVVEGDTVYGIAAKVGTTADALVAANGWESVNHVIYPGMKIKLPAKTG
jgi:LysM repeat protein